jgi:hypothetical protein
MVAFSVGRTVNASGFTGTFAASAAEQAQMRDNAIYFIVVIFPGKQNQARCKTKGIYS